MMMEVRCCCKPRALYGWLPVGPSAESQTWTWLCHDGTHITLPVALLLDGADTRLALKSEETPIERLRMIEGFIENTQGDDDANR